MRALLKREQPIQARGERVEVKGGKNHKSRTKYSKDSQVKESEGDKLNASTLDLHLSAFQTRKKHVLL